MISNATISVLLEAAIIMTVLYAYYLIFWKNSNAHNIKRTFLMVIPFVSMLIPLLNFPRQPYQTTLPTVDLQEIVFADSTSTLNASQWSFQAFIIIAYGAGVLIFSFVWLKNLTGIISIILSGKGKMTRKNGYHLIHTQGQLPTFSFFNMLFWNDRSLLDEVESDMILKHELAHIRHFHSLDIIITSIFRIVFWFNPVIHWIEKELSLVHEYVADEEASRYYSKREYINLLANQTLYHMKHQWIQSFNKGPLLKRLEALEKPALTRTRGRFLMLIPVLAALILAFSCESNQTSETANESSEKVEEALSKVEQMPQFPDGMDAMVTFLTQNLEYPESAKKEGKEGKVFVQFVVEKDGSISNAEVIKGFDEECNAEALRVVEAMPKWNPGTMEGKTVRTKMTLPIAFALGE